MNCHRGDLAVVVHSALGESVGTVLRCLRLSWSCGLRDRSGHFQRGAVWETDSYGFGVGGDIHNLTLDADLRPLRDAPGQDETLTWAGMPTTHHDL